VRRGVKGKREQHKLLWIRYGKRMKTKEGKERLRRIRVIVGKK
jgi:hypothetical protein